METIKPYGYPVAFGYVGRVNGKLMLFSTEADYEEYLKERGTNDSEEL